MKFTIATIAAAAAFFPMIKGHLSMNSMSGIYVGGDGMAPLEADGSNFPCTSDFSSSLGDGPTLNPGDAAQIELHGSAVHGGGSCQISITYDQPPKKNSVWKVLKSFEGGCPMKANGNLPADPTHVLQSLDYTLPKSLPQGKATIAWTWFNRLGNREMYMRCHKATIKGSSNDMGAFSALPDMFVAQIGITTCSFGQINVKFPNPGTQVEESGEELGDPQGDCGPKDSNPKLPLAQTSPPPSLPTTTPKPLPTTTPKPTTTLPTTTPQPTTPLTPTSIPKSSNLNTDAACTDGERKCRDENWSLCDHGVWVNMGPLSPGDSCSIIMTRSIRFSAAHMVRRALGYFHW